MLDDDGKWTYAEWADDCVNARAEYLDLVRKWNRYVTQFNNTLRPRNVGGTKGVNANNLSVVQASHGLGVAGNFQPISFTAITASVRLVTFSDLRIAVT